MQNSNIVCYQCKQIITGLAAGTMSAKYAFISFHTPKFAFGYKLC